MRDTTAEAERVRLEAIERLPPGERLGLALEWSESARRLALAGLRARHPGLTDLELVEIYAGTRLVPSRARRADR